MLAGDQQQSSAEVVPDDIQVFHPVKKIDEASEKLISTPADFRFACRKYTQEALDTMVTVMRDAADRRLQLLAAEKIMHRAYGPPMPRDDQDDQVTMQDLLLSIIDQASQADDA